MTVLSKQINQTELISMFENMKALRAGINSIDEQRYKASEPFRYGKSMADQLDIPKCMDAEALFHALGFVLGKINAYNDAVELSGYSQAPIPSWNRTPLEMWRDDFVLRLKVLTRETRAKDLEKDMKTVAKAIDPEVLQQKELSTLISKYKELEH